MISIITTVYNNDKYIEDAILSFIESCGEIEYEILIGVDNCKISLNHLLYLYPKLNKNIKIFYFKNRVGTYVIRNTLSTISRYDNLIFFDSDDVMRQNTVHNVLKHLNDGYDFFRFGFLSFSGELKHSKLGHLNLPFSHHFGAFGIKKKVFNELNGFEPWICAADGEFFWRINANNYKVFNSKEINLLYRRHSTNLTSGSGTGMKSELRKKYHKIKDTKISKSLKGPLNKMTISTYDEINETNFHSNIFLSDNKEFSIIIPTYDNPNFLEKTLESIIFSIKDLDCEILVGIDNCEKTKKFVLNKSFDNRIKFLFFTQNVGPYAIKNSLSKISNSNWLIFFDSDDIMNVNFIDVLFEYRKEYNLIKPMYLNFENDESNIDFQIVKTNNYGEGVFIVEKEFFLSLYGFRHWRCAADSEFMNRVYTNKIKIIGTKKICFYRRVHSNSLTQHPQTGLASKLRHDYIKSKKGPLKYLKTELFYEVSTNYLDNNNSEIFVQQKNSSDLVNEILVSIGDTPINPNQEKKIKDTVKYDLVNQIINNKSIYTPTENTKQPLPQNKPKNRQEISEIKKGSLVHQSIQMKKTKPNSKNSIPNVFGGRYRF